MALRVSTHAPAKGATMFLPLYMHSHTRFNSRAREGRDENIPLLWIRRISFNSRAREGRDQAYICQSISFTVSTHAPAKGATGGYRAADGDGLCFNSRAREGRDVSTHAPAKGATHNGKNNRNIS